MKQFRNLLLVTAFMVLIVEGSGSNLKQHIVIDNTSNPTLHHVIRRNPEVTVNERMSTLPPREGPSQVMNFGNTSDNNGVSLSVDYGKSPEIAGPAIYVHNKGKQSVITETPAHVGWRTETKTITSLNKETGKVEQHKINSNVKYLNTDTSRRFDLDSKQWGLVQHTVFK